MNADASSVDNQRHVVDAVKRVSIVLNQPGLEWAKSFIEASISEADMSLLTTPYNLSHSVTGECSNRVVSTELSGDCTAKLLFVPAISVGRYSVGIAISRELHHVSDHEKESIILQRNQSSNFNAAVLKTVSGYTFRYAFPRSKDFFDTESGTCMVFGWPLENVAEPSVELLSKFIRTKFGPQGFTRKIFGSNILRVTYWSENEHFQATVDPDLLAKGQTGDSLLFCQYMAHAKRDLCYNCAVRRRTECVLGLVKCSCRIQCERPCHPLDLEVQKRNIMALGGLYSGGRIIWSSAVAKPGMLPKTAGNSFSSAISIWGGEDAELLSIALQKLPLHGSTFPRLSIAKPSKGPSNPRSANHANMFPVPNAVGAGVTLHEQVPHNPMPMQNPMLNEIGGTCQEEAGNLTLEGALSNNTINAEGQQHVVRGGLFQSKTVTLCQDVGASQQETRRERNRAYAARSNLRRKEKNDALKAGIREARQKVTILLQREGEVRRQNAELKQRLIDIKDPK